MNQQVCPITEFVERWQKAASPADAAAATGHTVAGARYKAWELRKAGVPLKKFNPGGRREKRDIAELIRIARRFAS